MGCLWNGADLERNLKGKLKRKGTEASRVARGRSGWTLGVESLVFEAHQPEGVHLGRGGQ